MANEENLIPFDKRTESEQREIAKNGGTASGAARRRKRNLREAADIVLSLKVKDEDLKNALRELGVPKEYMDNQTAVMVGLVRKAIQGDSRAAKTLFELFPDEYGDGQRNEQEAPDDGFIEAIRGEAEETWQD